jgi:hypothetical protein
MALMIIAGAACLTGGALLTVIAAIAAHIPEPDF